MHLNYIYPIGVAVFGAIFVLVGHIQLKKCRCFGRSAMLTDAEIVRIDNTKRRHHDHGTVYVVYAQYEIDGKVVEGRHFKNIRGKDKKCRVGDRLQVIVPPENPKIFALKNISVSKEKWAYIKMVAFGIFVMALSLAVPVIGMLTKAYNSR